MNGRASNPGAAFLLSDGQRGSIRAVLAFFALAFAWSWSVGFWAQSAMDVSLILGTGLAILSGFGPSLAGFVIVALLGERLGFRAWVAIAN